jgi:hypothetical protein
MSNVSPLVQDLELDTGHGRTQLHFTATAEEMERGERHLFSSLTCEANMLLRAPLHFSNRDSGNY